MKNLRSGKKSRFSISERCRQSTLFMMTNLRLAREKEWEKKKQEIAPFFSSSHLDRGCSFVMCSKSCSNREMDVCTQQWRDKKGLQKFFSSPFFQMQNELQKVSFSAALATKNSKFYRSGSSLGFFMW